MRLPVPPNMPPSSSSLAARLLPSRARTLHASQEACFFTHTATFLHFRCATQLSSAPCLRAKFSAYRDVNGVRGRAGAYMDRDEGPAPPPAPYLPPSSPPTTATRTKRYTPPRASRRGARRRARSPSVALRRLRRAVHPQAPPHHWSFLAPPLLTPPGPYTTVEMGSCFV
ncbi:hypothetical protein K438DRAFT_2027816, partial [Mycena galopus ATCC 62051]